MHLTFFFDEASASITFFSSLENVFFCFFYMTQHYTIYTLTLEWSQYISRHFAVCKTSARDSELKGKLYNPLPK